MKWRVHQWARTPFPLVPHGGGSVLAVKGSLRALDYSGPIRGATLFTRGKGGKEQRLSADHRDWL